MALNGKMQAYAEARAMGLKSVDAAAHAGYAGGPGLRVAASKIEARVDVQAEIRRLKKAGGPTLRDEIAAAAGIDNDSKDKWKLKDKYDTPLDLLRDVWNNPEAPKTLRYQAAKDAMPYCHARKEGGKKEDAKDKAKSAGKKGSKFQTMERPGTRMVQ